MVHPPVATIFMLLFQPKSGRNFTKLSIKNR